MGKKIIKAIIAILAILNLILLFGFEYEIPGIYKKEDPVEMVADSSTEKTASIGKSDYNKTESTTESVTGESTLTEEKPEAASTGENTEYAVTGNSSETAEDGTTEIVARDQPQRCKVISKKNARIRSGPGTEYERITSVPFGTILTILGEEKGWYHIQTEDNITGYISGELVEVIK